ncbi:MAG: carboxypeptidase regulatory-like domain-containing protein [Terriglobia bacterium]
MRRFVFVFLAALVGSVAAPLSGAEQSKVPLPVRKVVLYKNGIGYFEHLGKVRGTQTVEITLPSRQLNDVLKSLTVIDLGRGRVAGVTYDSAAPLERRLGELPISLRGATSIADFLNQIRGTRVEVRAPGGTIAGRLMGAERRTRTLPGNIVTHSLDVIIWTDAGAIRTVELESAESLRLTDSALASDVGRYLDLLTTTHERDVRRLRISAIGSGTRDLYVSYTSEAPIWKTTYRLVLDTGKRPLLQGWAIVDNTTPQDWTDVELSLVAGAPVSFVQNLSQPLYARRPVVPLPEGLQVTPQVHEATLELPRGQAEVSGIVTDPTGAPIPGVTISVFDQDDNLVRQATTDETGRYRAIVAPGTYRVQADLGRFGTREYIEVAVHPGRVRALNFRLERGEEVEVFAERAEEARADVAAKMARQRRAQLGVVGGIPGRAPAAPPSPGEALRQARVATAQARELGEQFEYRLPQRVTIGRNQSALLPIVHTEVEGEKVSLFNEANDAKRARLALWLKNTSGLTLDAGAFTVIDSGAFAGEGLTETIQPGEGRLLSYALDLGVEVSANRENERQRVERVEISRGVLRMHSKVVEKKTYVIRNNDDKARTVVVEHRVRSGWEMIETPKPAESTASYHRFRVEAKAKTTSEFAVREENPRQTTYALTNITPEQIALWVRERTIDREIERALAAIVAKKNQIADLNRQMKEADQESNRLFRDQQRMRENLRALGRTPEEARLRQRYIRQMNAQENRLEALRTRRAQLEQQRDAAQKELDAMLGNLTFDRKL